MSKLVCVFLGIYLFCSCNSNDPSVQTIAWVGCNRRGSDWDDDKSPDKEPSGANVNQLTQTINDLNQLSIPDNQTGFFFMAGDLVPGFNEPSDLSRELDAWSSLFGTLHLSKKFNFVPLTGNHESLTVKDKVEVMDANRAAVWSTWLTANQFDPYTGHSGASNAAPNLDNLVNDQTKFSYSFNKGNIHYIILNTDTPTTSNAVGLLPFNWLKNDIQNSQNDPSIRTILIFAHKPILPPKPPAGKPVVTGDVTIDSSLVQPMIDLLDQNSKVKGYLCAHAHSWDAQQLGKRGVWQVISGFGGSPLDDDGNPASGPYFGFTVLTVYQSGKITVTEYTRPAPDPYTGTTVAAVPKQEFTFSF